jgi:hypothetical protein
VNEARAGRVALMWRGDSDARRKATAGSNRLNRVFAALAEHGLSAEPAVYSDELVEEVREQLLQVDGVLVWVDPLSDGQDRSKLDAMLRDVAAAGVWVSTHPEVILKMGTKEVLYRTRDLGWGTDCHLYKTVQELREQLPARLASGLPRVLKQNRGNGGQGVWKVEQIGGVSDAADSLLDVLHAQRGSVREQLRLSNFVQRCEQYFAGGSCMLDQAFQPRLPEGMIRCYMVHERVVGFGHQLIKALVPPPPGGPSSEAAQPGPRIMHGASAASFQALRSKMESEWVPAMQQLLHITTESLPVIWDADFLYGPKTATGEDTYVLCEINVSAVFPFPDEAISELARAAAIRIQAARVGPRSLPLEAPR